MDRAKWIMKQMTMVILVLLCSSCASTADQAGETREAREYRTGSNVAVRDRGKASDVKTLDVDSLSDLGKGMPARRPGSN